MRADTERQRSVAATLRLQADLALDIPVLLYPQPEIGHSDLIPRSKARVLPDVNPPLQHRR